MINETLVSRQHEGCDLWGFTLLLRRPTVTSGDWISPLIVTSHQIEPQQETSWLHVQSYGSRVSAWTSAVWMSVRLSPRALLSDFAEWDTENNIRNSHLINDHISLVSVVRCRWTNKYYKYHNLKTHCSKSWLKSKPDRSGTCLRDDWHFRFARNVQILFTDMLEYSYIYRCIH